MDKSHYAEALLGHIAYLDEEIKRMENPRFRLIIFPGDEKWLEENINQLKKELREDHLKLAELIDNNNLKKENGMSLKWNSPIKFDSNKQAIQIRSHIFYNFKDFFWLLKTENSTKKSQIKSGVLLIYALFNYIDDKKTENDILVSNLDEYCKIFKTKWSNRWFKNQGIKKKSIITTDCIRATEILSKCGLPIKFQLSKDKLKIHMINKT